MRLFVLLLLAAPIAHAQSAEAWRQSYALEAKGDNAGALAVLATTGPASNEYVLQLRRGWLQYLAGRFAEAIPAYEKAIALEPRALEPRLGILLPLMALRRWADAEKQGTEALTIAPTDFTALSRVAFIQYSQLRNEKAEATYRKALQLYPGSVEMRAGLGWALLRGNKLKEARAELERVVAVAPDHASARDGLSALP